MLLCSQDHPWRAPLACGEQQWPRGEPHSPAVTTVGSKMQNPPGSLRAPGFISQLMNLRVEGKKLLQPLCWQLLKDIKVQNRNN